MKDDFDDAKLSNYDENIPIVDVFEKSLGVSLTSLLLMIGCVRLGDVSSKSESYFLSIHGFGPKAVEKMKVCMKKYDAQFDENSGMDVEAIMCAVHEAGEEIGVKRPTPKSHLRVVK